MVIRFGLVGLKHGHYRSFARGAQGREDVELVALAEEDGDIRDQASGELGIEAYGDYRAMLDREALDAVGVAAINSRRAGIICELLEAGIHVISDKPMATSMRDLMRLEDAAKTAGAVLYLNLSLRAHPLYHTARGLVQKGAIGQVASCMVTGPHTLRRDSRPGWMFDRRQYGGILVDLAVHDVDLIRWLTGSEVRALTANHSNLRFTGERDFEDNGQIFMRLASGAVGYVDVNWLTPDEAPFHGDYMLYISGTEGIIEVRAADDRLLLTVDGEGKREVECAAPGSLFDHFMETLGGGEPLLTARDALEATRITLLARDSADRGGRRLSAGD